jgi:hypothetical protein
LGWKLFIDAQALISVPSTEKCSSEQRRHLPVGEKGGQELARHVHRQKPAAGLSPGPPHSGEITFFKPR